MVVKATRAVFGARAAAGGSQLILMLPRRKWPLWLTLFNPRSTALDTAAPALDALLTGGQTP